MSCSPSGPTNPGDMCSSSNQRITWMPVRFADAFAVVREWHRDEKPNAHTASPCRLERESLPRSSSSGTFFGTELRPRYFSDLPCRLIRLYGAFVPSSPPINETRLTRKKKGHLARLAHPTLQDKSAIWQKLPKRKSTTWQRRLCQASSQQVPGRRRRIN